MPKYGSVETSSSSSGPVRRVMSNVNLSVDFFDGSDHFGMWQGEVEQKYGYKNETFASKMWKALEEKFLKKRSQNRLHMKKILFRFDYQPDTSMNETFKDEDLALMLLSSLPDEFEHLEKTYFMEENQEGEQVRSSGGHGGKRSLEKSKAKVEREKKDCPKLKKKGKAAPDACGAEHDAHDSGISLVALSTTFHSDEWILDSGCNYHISPNLEWFSDLVELNTGVVYMGNDNACKTVGIGSIRLKNQDGSTRVLTDVRYVPSLKKNLISLGALESKGSVVTMRDGVLKVTYDALVMMKGIRRNNLYYYQGSTIIGAVAAAFGGDDLDATQLWHMRLGHAGEKSLQILAKKRLLKGAKACKLNVCEHCVLGKQKRVKFGTTIHNIKGIVDYIHSDVYPMKSKDEVLQFFLKLKNMIENQTGRKIKRLRTDNGGEYKSDPFFDVFHEYGIVRHFTVRHTPQQNGVAEHMNQTLLEKVRCMLSNAGRKTPLEVWSGKPATDYDSLYVFGSTAYYHVKESKLDLRENKAIFMGITHGVKGFGLWCLDTKKIICCRDVTFDESALVKKVEFQQTMIPEVDAADSSTPIEESEDEDVQTQEPLETPKPLAVTRPMREIRRPARFVDIVAYALPFVDDDIPITYQEAIQSLESDKWKSAMDEEMQSLQKNNTWKLAQLPKGKRAIGCKWVFVKKDGSHSKKYVRYKARLVAKGYAQKEGIDYNEVFSPVVKHSSIRILLALVAQLNLELAQLDVKMAFLHAISEAVLKDGSFTYILLYVDDMLITLKSQKEIDKLKAQLNQEFEMKDLGEAKKILDRVYMAKVPYANAIGSLMYAMVCTCPDISQAVGVDEALGQCVVGYADSDYAGDLDKRRSTTRYLFTLAKAPISWKSTLQSTVALSTTEAEYMAISEAVKEVIWLNGLMEDLGVVQSHISLYCDSQSSIHLAKNQVYHSWTKHIDARYHFVREIFEEGKIILQKITTSENPTDMMTKVFGKKTMAMQSDGGEWKAERKHRPVVEMRLTLLAQAALPMKFWSHAFTIVVYLINWLPSSCHDKKGASTGVLLLVLPLRGSSRVNMSVSEEPSSLAMSFPCFTRMHEVTGGALTTSNTKPQLVVSNADCVVTLSEEVGDGLHGDTMDDSTVCSCSLPEVERQLSNASSSDHNLGLASHTPEVGSLLHEDVCGSTRLPVDCTTSAQGMCESVLLIPTVCDEPVVNSNVHLMVSTFQALSLFRNGSKQSETKLSPGPRWLLIFGNLFDLGNKPHRSLAKLAQVQGPIMGLQLGILFTVVVSSETTAKEVLKEQDLIFCNRTIVNIVLFGNLFDLGDKPHMLLAKHAQVHGAVMGLQLGILFIDVISSKITTKEVIKEQDLVLCNQTVIDVVRAYRFNEFGLSFIPVSPLW
ncbi:hypothetical protein F3Y22_tig00110864pilonHSYRG00223 [Hibiscus syriacus]|uniref:Integrase catalytic domain-containing protein n=1 Tax=Hibiscus syriacus TaxID=106335 RepID=A0A6A2ZKX3_HIBSY|nr:hypothetical protein F3Y22_tig00110864pilonHSYRG00223 [Hibiscus syriacus]